LLRYLKMDLIAACVAVTSLFVMQRPPVQPNITVTPTVLSSPIQAGTVETVTPKKKMPHPLRAIANLGMASWYGAVLEGHRTASGEIFHKDEMTACHPTLPFGTIVRVVDVHSGRSVVVRINDRGILFPERIIDLSSAAANELGILRSGVAKVRLEILKKVDAVGPNGAPARHGDMARTAETSLAAGLGTGMPGPKTAALEPVAR
jgi:rare lipoprotein A